MVIGKVSRTLPLEVSVEEQTAYSVVPTCGPKIFMGILTDLRLWHLSQLAIDCKHSAVRYEDELSEYVMMLVWLNEDVKEDDIDPAFIN